jgi:hypothetical protein
VLPKILPSMFPDRIELASRLLAYIDGLSRMKFGSWVSCPFWYQAFNFQRSKYRCSLFVAHCCKRAGYAKVLNNFTVISATPIPQYYSMELRTSSRFSRFLDQLICVSVLENYPFLKFMVFKVF